MIKNSRRRACQVQIRWPQRARGPGISAGVWGRRERHRLRASVPLAQGWSRPAGHAYIWPPL